MIWCSLDSHQANGGPLVIAAPLQALFALLDSGA